MRVKSLAQNYQLLYIEDNSNIPEKTVTFFRSLFKHVDIATDGKKALELYNKNSSIYAIVMTNLNGIEIIKDILKINNNQKIIVIFNNNDSKLLPDAITLGIEHFIQKPWKFPKMLEIIDKSCVIYHLDNLQYFRSLEESSIVSKTDANGIITYVNDLFCKTTGYTKDELIGHTHNILRNPDYKESFYKSYG